MSTKTSDKDVLMAMELHETVRFDQIVVTRVPGGWIYETPTKDDDIYFNATFVPDPTRKNF